MKIHRLLLILSLLAGSACAKTQPVEPDLIQTATIKDIMAAMIDPSAEYLFELVVTTADEHGITEKAPQTDEEWNEARSRAVTLLEAPNLLVMKGRKVAKPGDKPENPQLELTPGQIQTRIDNGRIRFMDRARALQEAAMRALNAIDSKDKHALLDALTGIDKACENCHLDYWYLSDNKTAQ